MKMSEIQSRVYAALTANVELMEMITTVSEVIPQSSAYPYIRICDNKAIRRDTDSRNALDITVKIQIFSDQHGKEIRKIMDKVYQVLHYAELEGFDFCRYDDSEVYQDKEIHVGVIYFQALSK